MMSHIGIYFGVVLLGNLLLGNVAQESAKNPLVIIIRSQENEYHHQVALETKLKLEEQIQEEEEAVKVVLLHEEWPVEQAWVITPILPVIMKKYADNYDWVMFIEETTKVDVKKLLREVLVRFDPTENHFLGRCLFDNSPSIIHHFAFFDGNVKEFHFPDFDAGWLLSSKLLTQVGLELDSEEGGVDFQIDVKHELAMFLDKKYKVKLTCVKELCGGKSTENCATSIESTIPDCGTKITNDHLFFAIKTTKMFHETRVQIVKKTWGKYPKNLIYFSNVTDPSIPSLDCGVPNTLRGHCGKMEAIILHAYNKMKDIPWLVIADDDTILGVSKLVRLLNCYNPDEIMVLGERYGYALNKGYGYGYITGGGGMILSRAAVEAWVNDECSCPSIETPDDMYLGQCFSFKVGVPVTHSPLFHQARPVDYADGFLSNQEPVSFHKHWENDPVKVYNKYFEKEDEEKYGEDNVTAPPVTAATPTPPPEHGPVPIPPTPTENQVRDEL